MGKKKNSYKFVNMNDETVNCVEGNRKGNPRLEWDQCHSEPRDEITQAGRTLCVQCMYIHRDIKRKARCSENLDQRQELDGQKCEDNLPW